MLQQILADMYIDPDVLEALNEEQKKILFFKMREEQIRRWKVRQEQEEREDVKKEKLRQKKGSCKTVSWLLGSDGDVHVCIIGESDEIKSPKRILSELRGKTVTNSNNLNSRALTESGKTCLSKPYRAQQASTEPGIQLLLKNAEELRESPTLSDESKQDSASEHSADDTRGQSDDSDSGSGEYDIGIYRPHTANRENAVAEQVRELQLHREKKEQLSINKSLPLDTPTSDKACNLEIEVASLECKRKTASGGQREARASVRNRKSNGRALVSQGKCVKAGGLQAQTPQGEAKNTAPSPLSLFSAASVFEVCLISVLPAPLPPQSPLTYSPST
ncbi:hypothetical protein DNTS_031616 [Danionella cerebrum]|uniref:SH2 domain-containing protein n=1 Tax=Danionella cerebrum TaxID=2873325 RepID=A0A553QJM1_9TELE|nr:hypothetical protein DNTS_031616 [Danionella translucida]